MRTKIRTKHTKSKEFLLSARERELQDMKAKLDTAVDEVEKLTNRLNAERSERKLIERANEQMYALGEAAGYDRGLKAASKAFSQVIIETHVTEVQPCLG